MEVSHQTPHHSVTAVELRLCCGETDPEVVVELTLCRVDKDLEVYAAGSVSQPCMLESS